MNFEYYLYIYIYKTVTVRITTFSSSSLRSSHFPFGFLCESAQPLDFEFIEKKKVKNVEAENRGRRESMAENSEQSRWQTDLGVRSQPRIS